MPLTSLLELVPGPAGSKVEYVVGGQKLEPAAREQAAQMLADDAMALRCGQSPALERWRATRDGHTPHDTVSAETVLTYAAIGFGSPDKPAHPNHLQGLVAELVWNRLMKERREWSGGRTLVKAHSVKPDPLEPGGDGLVVYRVDDDLRLPAVGDQEARRRETGLGDDQSGQSSSWPVAGRSTWRNSRAPTPSSRRGRSASSTPRSWSCGLMAATRAGVGVSVGTSDDARAEPGPARFRSIATAFPHFSDARAAGEHDRGCPGLPRVRQRVREIVWSGL